MKKILFLVVALMCVAVSHGVAKTLYFKTLWYKPYRASYLHQTDDKSKLYQIDIPDDYTNWKYIQSLNPLTGDIIDTLFKMQYTDIFGVKFLTDSLILMDNFRSKSSLLGGLMLYNLYTKEYKYIDTGYGDSWSRYKHYVYIPKNSKRLLIKKINSANQFTTHYSVFDLGTWKTICDTTFNRDPWSYNVVVNYDMITDSLLLQATYNKDWDYGEFKLINIYTWKVEKYAKFPKEHGAIPTLSKSRKYLDLGYGDPKLIIKTDNLKLVSSIPNCMECYSAFFVKSDRYLIYNKGNVNIVYDMKNNEEVGTINISSEFDGFSDDGELAWKNVLRMWEFDWDNFSGKKDDIKNIDKLYPNPVNSTINFETTIPKYGNYTISINSINGKEEMIDFQGELQEGLFQRTIDISKLVNGTYLLRIQSDTFNRSWIFIKEK